MSDDLRVNRQSSAQHQQPMKQDMGTQGEMQQESGSAGSKMPWVILGAVVVVLIILGVLFRGQLFKGSGSGGAAMAPTSGPSGYQAVFLTNGQVYFGKLTNADTDYPMLTDIYYLQVVQPPLQGTPATGQAPAATGTQAQPQISLVKLGNELHGPVDEMHISRPQILFYEDLKADGSVVKAIEAYKANPTGTPTPTPAPVK